MLGHAPIEAFGVYHFDSLDPRHPAHFPIYFPIYFSIRLADLCVSEGQPLTKSNPKAQAFTMANASTPKIITLEEGWNEEIKKKVSQVVHFLVGLEACRGFWSRTTGRMAGNAGVGRTVAAAAVYDVPLFLLVILRGVLLAGNGAAVPICFAWRAPIRTALSKKHPGRTRPARPCRAESGPIVSVTIAGSWHWSS